MSRRNIKPTTFHDDSRSSDAGSVAAAPSRSKPRTIKDPAKDLLALRDGRVDPQVNNIPTSSVKVPQLGPDGEIQVDFNALPIQALQKYKHHYNLNQMEPPPQKKPKQNNSQGKKRPHEDSEDDLSNSEDENPYRIDLGAWRPRINKSELAKTARTHFGSLPQARENDTIVQFLYAVKMQDKVLKISTEN